MFQTAAGVTVPFPEKLSEQYELDGNTITIGRTRILYWASSQEQE